MDDTRDLRFDRVQVDYMARGGARVSWRLREGFLPASPRMFKIQASAGGVAEADDWADASAAAEDAGHRVDATARGAGRVAPVHYRVVLSSPDGTFVSRPAAATGLLDKHDWLIAREIVRQHRLRLGKSAGVRGWLLRRRWAGATPDPLSPSRGAIDPADGSVIRPWAPSTAGTAYSGGFFAPSPFLVDPSPAATRDVLDPNRGAADDDSLAVQALVVAIPPLASGDLFATDGGDRRYYIQPVRNAAERRGVPLVQSAQLRRAPAGDPAYALEVPATWPS